MQTHTQQAGIPFLAMDESRVLMLLEEKNDELINTFKRVREFLADLTEEIQTFEDFLKCIGESDEE
jgi:hypothetical protein